MPFSKLKLIHHSIIKKNSDEEAKKALDNSLFLINRNSASRSARPLFFKKQGEKKKYFETSNSEDDSESSNSDFINEDTNLKTEYKKHKYVNNTEIFYKPDFQLKNRNKKDKKKMLNKKTSRKTKNYSFSDYDLSSTDNYSDSFSQSSYSSNIFDTNSTNGNTTSYHEKKKSHDDTDIVSSITETQKYNKIRAHKRDKECFAVGEKYSKKKIKSNSLPDNFKIKNDREQIYYSVNTLGNKILDNGLINFNHNILSNKNVLQSKNGSNFIIKKKGRYMIKFNIYAKNLTNKNELKFEILINGMPIKNSKYITKKKLEQFEGEMELDLYENTIISIQNITSNKGIIKINKKTIQPNNGGKKALVDLEKGEFKKKININKNHNKSETFILIEKRNQE